MSQKQWWESRIHSLGEVSPKSVMANAANYRRHPAAQRRALQTMIQDVGFVQPILVNINTNNIVDGHLRVELAHESKQEKIPVIYIDVTEEEEKLLLATLDPITNMAVIDKSKFDEILWAVSSQSQIVNDMWDAMKREAPAVAKKVLDNATSTRPQSDAEPEVVTWEPGTIRYAYDAKETEKFLHNTVRTISIYLQLPDYELIIKQMDVLLRVYNLKSYQELIMKLVADTHEQYTEE